MSQKLFFILSVALLLQLPSCMPTAASESYTRADLKTGEDELFAAISRHIHQLVQSNVDGFLRIHKLLKDKSGDIPSTNSDSNSAIDLKMRPLPALPLNFNTEMDPKTRSVPAPPLESNAGMDLKTRHKNLFNFTSSQIYSMILFNMARVQRLYKLLLEKATEMPDKNQSIAEFLPQLKDYVEYLEKLNSDDDNFLKFLISSQLLGDLNVLQSNIDSAVEGDDGNFAQELKKLMNTAFADMTAFAKEKTESIVNEVRNFVAGLSNEETKTEKRLMNWWLRLSKEENWMEQRDIILTYLL